MIFEIVFGVICFVWGVVILTGKVDKWLIYPFKKINIKRFRLITGIGNLLGGFLFILDGCFGGYNTILFVMIAILVVVIIALQYTWSRKIPENQTA